MTATQPKPAKAAKTIYRAKVTGRHAITLPAEVCRQLGIEVGDSVELEMRGGKVEMRPVRETEILTIASLQGILRPFFKDWEDIQQHIRELRAEWDDAPEFEEPLVDERSAE